MPRSLEGARAAAKPQGAGPTDSASHHRHAIALAPAAAPGHGARMTLTGKRILVIGIAHAARGRPGQRGK